MYSIRTRLLVLIVLSFFLTSAILALWHRRQQSLLAAFLAHEQQERSQLFHRVLELQHADADAFLFNNSYWDELVDFVKAPNPTWARQSIAEPALFQHIDATFILTTDGRVVYAHNRPGLSVSPESARNLVFWKRTVKQTFTHAYTVDQGQIVELFGAPICGSDDPQRRKTRHGFLVCARVWNETQLDRLEKLTGAHVTIDSLTTREAGTRHTARNHFQSTRVTDEIPWDENSTLEIRIPLKPMIGGGVPELRALVPAGYLISTQQLLTNAVVFFLCFSAGIMLLLFVSLHTAVSRPLRDLARALREGRTDERLARIDPHSREIVELTHLVEEFFVQRAALSDANEHLEQKVAERTADLKGAIDSHRLVEQHLKTVLTNAPIALFALDGDGVIRFVEGDGFPSFGQVVSRSLNRSAYRLCRPFPALKQRLATVFNDGEEQMFTLTLRGVTSDLRLRPLRDDNETVVGAIGVALDVTERERFQGRLRHQALHDALTGLPNRAHFRESLDSAVEEARKSDQSLALLFLDLDNFKLVNDSLGHEAGDRLLIAIAEHLKRLADGVGLVARIAGDEFTVLLDVSKGRGHATRFASRLSAVLQTPVRLGGREVVSSASIGIAFSENGALSGAEMLRHADVAMYRAKAMGRGRWATFDETMSQDLRERLEMESELRGAAERGELEVYYQPIVNLNTREIVEVEALVRWHHPRYGLIPPARFLKIAEESGIILAIDYWTLRHACQQVSTWNAARADGNQLVLNVNLSALQFRQTGWSEMLITMLEQAPFPARHLKLEITESVMMEDPVATARRLRRLKDRGVRVAIDDFGTGYSSMAYLASLPLDTLKIDRSFIQQMSSDGPGVALVRAVRQLAVALGLDITCEGIETTRQLEQLRAIGCERAQGYLFSPPVPADKLEELLRDGIPFETPNPVSPSLSKAA